MKHLSETIVYADCFSGISGDMFLAALLDLGLPEQVLRDKLAKLDLGADIVVTTNNSPGFRATRVSVAAGSGQPPRSWPEIKQFLEESHLETGVKSRAVRVFSALASAEARVHGCSPEAVHFHELGAVDTIVDIVGVAVGLEHLGIDRLVASPLPMPHGWVTCQHGPLPLPAPAVCELLAGVPVYGVDLDQELVTPTGAALLVGLASGFGRLPPMAVAKTGYGAGSIKRPDGKPNLLRLILGHQRSVAEAQQVEVIESHLDDLNPELLPFLLERLFAAGCLDASLVPIQMKKGRPGFLLRVIADPAAAWEMKQLILAETTATGLRFRTEQRLTLPRQTGTVPTPWGPVRSKLAETPAGPVLYPEYEDCRRLALERQVPLKEVYRAVGQCRVEAFREETGLSEGREE